MDKRLAYELLEFIKTAPTSYHAAMSMKEKLLMTGFIELKENEKWKLESGQGYFVTRNSSAFLAFLLPELTKEKKPGFRIMASHSDSPAFKIKENPDIAGKGAVTLNVEKYGGMILSTWFDRPLSAAGRIFYDTGKGIRERLVNIDRDLMVLPSLAIHMNREVNDGHKYDLQKEIRPIFSQGDEDAPDFMSFLSWELGIPEESILGHDLFLYNRMPGTIWGAQKEFLSSPRLDDLECVFASFKGFLDTTDPVNIPVHLVFDNEEVGSATRQGAGSTFLYDTLRRITMCLGMDEEDYLIMLANSRMLSADNAHAVHPNYREKADPVNSPVLNGGIVIKYNANQKYCTDGFSAAAFKKMCLDADIPYQTFTNNSNIAGGSTLGNISNTKVALPSVDIGLPQLAMHSSYETAGVRDIEDLCRAAAVFYRL